MFWDPFVLTGTALTCSGARRRLRLREALGFNCDFIDAGRHYVHGFSPHLLYRQENPSHSFAGRFLARVLVTALYRRCGRCLPPSPPRRQCLGLSTWTKRWSLRRIMLRKRHSFSHAAARIVDSSVIRARGWPSEGAVHWLPPPSNSISSSYVQYTLLLSVVPWPLLLLPPLHLPAWRSRSLTWERF